MLSKKAVMGLAVGGSVAVVGIVCFFVANSIINNSYSTEDILSGDTSGNVGEVSIVSDLSKVVNDSDLKENESSKKNTDEGSFEVSYYEDSSDVYDFSSSEESSNSTLYNQLGEGYDDVFPEAVEQKGNGQIFIYNVSKDMWKGLSDNRKLDFKCRYYYDKLWDIPHSDDGTEYHYGDVSEYVERSLYLLGTELFNSEYDTENSTYDAIEGTNEDGRKLYSVDFKFSNGSELNFIYDASAYAPEYIMKNGDFTDYEKRVYGCIVSNFTGYYDIADKDGMKVIGWSL